MSEIKIHDRTAGSSTPGPNAAQSRDGEEYVGGHIGFCLDGSRKVSKLCNAIPSRTIVSVSLSLF